MEGHYGYDLIVTPQVDGGYTVSVPDLPDLVTEADTREEALAMARDAIAGYLEAMRDHGWDVPRAREVEHKFRAVQGLTPARRPKQPAGKPLKTKGIVSDLLPEQRR